MDFFVRVPSPFNGEGERIVSSTNSIGTNEFPHVKEWSCICHHTICKHEQKWINNLNIKAKTIKVSDKGTGKIFMTLDLAIASYTWHQKYEQ